MVIVQEGSDLFCFETIRHPSMVYPIVHKVKALGENSPEKDWGFWKWISRDRFDWLLKHHTCMVSFVSAGEPEGRIFHCTNHDCWEKEGVNVAISNFVSIDPIVLNEDEERVV